MIERPDGDGKSAEWAFRERHLSESRLRLYLGETDGDKAAAMRLYDWNVEVSGAFWEALSFFEIVLRNAINSRMELRHAERGRSGHWIFDDADELGRNGLGQGRHQHPYVDIAAAVRRTQRNHKPTTPGQVISEVSFGFWHQMLASRQLFLWPDLAAAFSNSSSRRQSAVHDPVARLRNLRNRIGHHHRIWPFDLADRYQDLLLVASFIDEDLPAWIEVNCRVRDVLAKRPRT